MTNAEIDRLVAEKVMGWAEGLVTAGQGYKVWEIHRVNPDDKLPFLLSDWSPTENPAHWEMVIDKLVGEGYEIEICFTERCAVTIYRKWPERVRAEHDSKGMAICLAALQAKK